MNLYASILLAAGHAYAAQPLWGQCGGIGWTGDTTCVSGAACVFSNDWYSQCLPSSSTTIRPSSSSSTTRPVSTTSASTSTATGFVDLAVAAGKQYFGIMIDNSDLEKPEYMVIAGNTHIFNQATPGNRMKWDATEPSRNQFSFSAADALVTWAQSGGRQLRGHTLVWHNQLPAWVTNGGFNNATLVSVLQNHVTNVAKHFAGKLKTWDVTNEIFNEDGTWRQSVFYKTIGEYYVDIAFRAAAAADPNVGLAANDYNLDTTNGKVAAYVALVKRLKARGVKITQVGSQAHLTVGQTPSFNSMVSALNSLVAAGVDVAITELDIRMQLPATSAKLEQQKKDYNTAIRACMAVPRCVGITIAGYTDKYSWIQNGAPLPYDENYRPKPAYYGIIDGLKGIADT
ncbi:related to endo-1,4-beta-xylanase [Serendipita indica DSM 11827]|uniref:Beta-xylanase n=1 Tax=Serendipita indica (strain DSM 11827) TaxID=1109443 RepID=G4TM75_SERID|nr:related to endo-1,4-beta-xylanase [Serendipita indica DSM 11827]